MNDALVFAGASALFMVYCAFMLCYSWMVAHRRPTVHHHLRPVHRTQLPYLRVVHHSGK
jgi:hypothetical protein